MKKRILCLLLSVLMIAACLAGCSKKTDEEAIASANEQASESAITLSMYLLCEEEISDEQAAEIEKAVNKITKAKFKTQLKLSFFTAEEYYVALEESFAKRKEAEDAGLIVSKPTNDESTEEETFQNEWGLSEIKYPTISGYQVDIFYMGDCSYKNEDGETVKVSGYDKFVKYLAENRLSNLNEEINSASKKLSSYITAEYLSYTKSVNNGIYAVPTNRAIGSYTYLLLNKEALAKYNYDTDEGLALLQESGVTGDAVQRFIASATDADADVKYLPFYSDLSDVKLASSGIYYWGVDEGGHFTQDFSLLASAYDPLAKYGTEASYMQRMGDVSNTNFYKQLRVVKGYGKTSAEQFANGEVAVACIQGGAEIPSKYAENYEAVVIGKPTLYTEDLYTSTFAVTSYTSSVSRSMEIVTYLNTNEDFRNLILYGIEGENYELVDSGYTDADGSVIKVVERLNNDYMMDVNKTGNTLIAYSLYGEDPTLKEFVKDQNVEVVISPTMGFLLPYSKMVPDMALLETLRVASATACDILNKCTLEELTPATPDAKSVVEMQISTIVAEAKCIPTLAGKIQPTEATPTTEDGNQICGLGWIYEQWGVDKKIYVRVESDE